MKNKKVTIYIDESGTLPDPQDRIIVIAAVATDFPRILLDINKTVRKRLQNQKKKQEISEIKFYRAGEKTKIDFLKKLSHSEINIFVLVVNKNGQKISDSPFNFAILSSLLLEECLLFYENQIKELVFDKHFSKKEDRKEFDCVLSDLSKNNFKISHVDSLTNPEVNSADMVAGSTLWVYTNKGKDFYSIISNRIISEKILNWKEAKRKFFDKLKKLHSNRCKHPSR